MPASLGYTEISRALSAAGVKMTPQAVRTAHRQGRIETEPDGTFDLERVVAALAGNRKVLKSTDPSYENLQTGGQSGETQPNLSYTAARTARELLDVQRRKLDLEVQRGNLLDKSKVLRTVEELASEFRDHWLQFSSRSSGAIAAELGVEPNLVSRVLDQYVVDHARKLPDTKLSSRL